MNTSRILPIFSLVFVLVYAIVFYFNWALFTYFPAQSAFFWSVPKESFARGSIPMFWYGWIATTTIVSAIVTALVACSPSGWTRAGLFPILVWASPLVATAVVLYGLRIWFTT